MRQAFIILSIFALAACSSTPKPKDSELPFATNWDKAKNRPKIALALGGGASRGFAHIGVIRILEQEKIPIDFIVGTSVGSLIGAMYAANPNSFELEWTAFKLEKEDIFDFSLFSSSKGFVLGQKLEAFVKSKIKTQRIEDLKIPLYVVATDLYNGQRIVFDSGPLATAVRASSAMPGVFHPVPYGRRMLVDGGVSTNLPVSVAKEKGADIVIAVDIGKNLIQHNIKNLMDISLQSVNILMYRLAEDERKNADVLIVPEVGTVKIMDFSKKKLCLVAGQKAARDAIPTIQRLLKAKIARP